MEKIKLIYLIKEPLEYYSYMMLKELANNFKIICISTNKDITDFCNDNIVVLSQEEQLWANLQRELGANCTHVGILNQSLLGPLHDFKIFINNLIVDSFEIWSLYQMENYLYGFILMQYKFLSKQILNELIDTGNIHLNDRHLKEMGINWKSLCHFGKNINCSTSNYELVVIKKSPFLELEFIGKEKRHQDLQYNDGSDLAKTAYYIRNKTQYDLKIFYQLLLKKYNIEDIKNLLDLNFIVDEQYCITKKVKSKVAILIHIYYTELFKTCINYISIVPKCIDVYITVSSVEHKEKIERLLLRNKITNASVILVNNRGRDLSALLVGCKHIVKQYKYICFVHDKKSHKGEDISTGRDYFLNLWNNLLLSETYIYNILNILEQEPSIGFLCPPPPVFGIYFSIADNYWTICYKKTYQLLSKLNIQPILHEKKQPLALGSAFWCKVEAIQDLFDVDWEYKDFPKEPMALDGTISHAIERVFPYIAQKNGFLSGWVMNKHTAANLITNQGVVLQESLRKTKKYLGYYDGIPCYLEKLENAMIEQPERVGVDVEQVGVKGAVQILRVAIVKFLYKHLYKNRHSK